MMGQVIPITSSDRIVTVTVEARIPAMVVRREVVDFESRIAERQAEHEMWADGRVFSAKLEMQGMGGTVEVVE